MLAYPSDLRVSGPINELLKSEVLNRHLDKVRLGSLEQLWLRRSYVVIHVSRQVASRKGTISPMSRASHGFYASVSYLLSTI